MENFGRLPSVVINLGHTLWKQNVCLCVDTGPRTSSLKKITSVECVGDHTNHHRMFLPDRVCFIFRANALMLSGGVIGRESRSV